MTTSNPLSPDPALATLYDQRFVHYPYPSTGCGATYAQCMQCCGVVEIGPRGALSDDVRLAYAAHHRQVCPLT